MSVDDHSPAITRSSGALLHRWSVLAALTLILGFAAFVRIRLIDLPLERDEGEYAYAGQLMLQGIPPYQLAYNMKLPGTYAAYAAVMAVFGESTRGIHLGLILVNSITSVLLYFLGRRLFGPICGVVAAACFALLSLSYSVLGLAAHATHFVTIFGIAGSLLLLRTIEKRNAWLCFWSGFLFGLAFLMKQQGVFFGVFGGIVLLRQELIRRPREVRRLWLRTASFSTGMLLPFALTCIAVAAAGVFLRFWFWTFSYARQYAATTPLAHGWLNFTSRLWMIFLSMPALYLLAGLGLLLLCWQRKDRDKSFCAIALLLASFATTCPGLYFRHHYFIPVLPALAICAGAAIQILSDEIRRRHGQTMALIIPIGLFVFATGDAVYRHRVPFFEAGADEAARKIYLDNPFPEAREIARYIREHSGPASRIAVLGSEPEIYFYSQRHSATGYIYTYPLLEPHPYALNMQQEMIAEIEANKPEFVVFVNVPSSWLPRPNSSSFIFDWFEKYADTNLHRVGLVDIFTDQPSVYRWEEKAVAVTPRSSSFVEIFKRNDLF